jgi:acyl-CoA thioester hydrolase
MTTVAESAPLDVEFGHVEAVTVHFDELDPMGILHNSRYAVLVERALTPYWTERGHTFDGGRPTTPDMFHAVREFTISYLAPIATTGPVWVHFWLDRFGESSGTYGFRILSRDGQTVHAHGTRSIVRLDPRTMRPTAWTDAGRAVAATLLRTAEEAPH